MTAALAILGAALVVVVVRYRERLVRTWHGLVSLVRELY